MGWDDAAWDGLVGDLYLSAIDRDAAARLPGRFAALTGGGIASLWRLRPQDNAMVGEALSNLPAEAVAAYRSHYYQHDPWGGAVLQAPRHSVLRGADIVDDTALAGSLYYNEFGLQHGMFHMIGALVPLGTAGEDHIGVISILQPKDANGFGDDAVAALARVLPHIGGAFRLREQIEAVTGTLRLDALDAALDAFGLAAVVLDGHGTVLRCNEMAERLACVRHAMVRRPSPQRTVGLSGPSGAMRLPAGSDRTRWAASIAAAARGEAGDKFRLVDQALPYLATITPLPPGLAALTGDVQGRVLLLLRPLAITDRRALAATLFGLTKAEADVAAALVDGLSPADIAAARGVKVSTVRTLLQRAQDKAECRNLRDLACLLASLG